MEYQHFPRSDELSELLSALTDPHCRAVLAHFRNAPEDVATVEDLAGEVTIPDDERANQLGAHLHHTTLPLLGDVGVLEYDPRSNTVRYRGHAELDALLDGLSELSSHQLTLD